MSKHTAVATLADGREMSGKFSTAAEAKNWGMKPEKQAVKVVLYDSRGRSVGWYSRDPSTGEWRDADMWGKSR